MEKDSNRLGINLIYFMDKIFISLDFTDLISLSQQKSAEIVSIFTWTKYALGWGGQELQNFNSYYESHTPQGKPRALGNT
jgi:hypothetical protein